MIGGVSPVSVDDDASRVGDYYLERRLGNGSFGTVFLASHVRSHEHFAIKCVPSAGDDRLVTERVRQEAVVMQGLQHPHVVRLIQLITTDTMYYFVMELADGGELYDNILNSQKFPESVARKYFQQLISAIYYCHSKNVVHRDLKAENLLLSSTRQLKVCDFGFSRQKQAEMDDDGENEETEVGTVSYMPPEMLNGQGGKQTDDRAHDLWASGVLLYFMLVGKLPFDGRDDEETFHNIVNNEIDFGLITQPRARELVCHMLEPDPDERYSMDDIIEDEWFQIGLDTTLFPSISVHRQHSRSFLDFSRTFSKGNLIDDLTDEEADIIRRCFNNICRDGYPELFTEEELRDALVHLKGSRRVEPSEVRDLMDKMKVPASRKHVTFEEFRKAWVDNDLAHRLPPNHVFQLKAMSKIMLDTIDPSICRELRQAFNMIDLNKDGIIEPADWRAMFAKANVSVSDTDIDYLNRFLDGSGLGHVTFGDFLHGIVKRNLLTKNKIGGRLAKAVGLSGFATNELHHDCINAGFTVVGEKRELVEKIAVYSPTKLMLHSQHESPNSQLDVTFMLLKKDSLGNSFSPSENRNSMSSNTSFTHHASPSRSPLHSSARSAGVACELDVILVPTQHEGYTAVRIKRISGSTTDFHDAVAIVSQSLENEREQAVVDSSPVGESELM